MIKLPIPVAILVPFWCIYFTALVSSQLFDPDSYWNSSYPIPLTTTERYDAPFFATLTEPMNIRLRIMEDQQFKREHPNAGAVAYPNRHPCEIIIPSGWMIVADPRDNSSGNWNRPSDGETLAHEILHCLRGAWHDKQ